MIKVCHMTSAHNPEDVRIFHKECVSLAQAGFEVNLVERGKSYTKYGVNIIGVGDKKGSRLKRMLLTTRAVYRQAVKVDADIYHFHDPELLPYGLLLKWKGKKVIFDRHENYYRQISIKSYINPLLRRLIASFYRIFEAFVCKRIDGVIVVVDYKGKDPGFNVTCKKKVAIANYPRLDQFNFNNIREITDKTKAKKVYTSEMIDGLNNKIIVSKDTDVSDEIL